MAHTPAGASCCHNGGRAMTAVARGPLSRTSGTKRDTSGAVAGRPLSCAAARGRLAALPRRRIVAPHGHRYVVSVASAALQWTLFQGVQRCARVITCMHDGILGTLSLTLHPQLDSLLLESNPGRRRDFWGCTQSP